MRMQGDAKEQTLLAVAGFDPSSGAGITADLAVFATHGFFGVSAITALTVQSTLGVRRTQPVAADLLAETLACLQADLPPAAIKIGMLGGVEQVQVVAAFLRSLLRSTAQPLVVLDPVLRSSSGAELLSGEGVAAMRSELLPLVNVVTPNASELAVLTGMPCQGSNEIGDAARSLASLHSGLSVIATGGDRPEPDDLVVHRGTATVLRGHRIDTRATHGTGCAFSSAVLCRLQSGEQMVKAAAGAKRYVEQAMRSARPRGSGHGPMNLLWPVTRRTED